MGWTRGNEGDPASSGSQFSSITGSIDFRLIPISGVTRCRERERERETERRPGDGGRGSEGCVRSDETNLAPNGTRRCVPTSPRSRHPGRAPRPPAPPAGTCRLPGRAAQGRGGDVRSGRRRRTIVVSLRELRASRRPSRNLMIISAELAL